MKITRRQLRQIINESIINLTEDDDQQAPSVYTTAVVFFYPGLRPNKPGGPDNVVEELDKQLSSISSEPGRVKKEDAEAATVRRLDGTSLFIVAKDHEIPWTALETIAREKSGPAYDGQNVKKYLAGYSAGTKGVVAAQNSGTRFVYTHLADPWPIPKAKYDKLTYRKGNWEAYDSYLGNLKKMINNNQGSVAEETASSKYDHPEHMKNAIKELLAKVT